MKELFVKKAFLRKICAVQYIYAVSHFDFSFHFFSPWYLFVRFHVRDGSKHLGERTKFVSVLSLKRILTTTKILLIKKP